jgi:phosphatidylinositol alpha-mannosyltransferase
VSGESFGIILVEAMASGARLVIAGNNPGYSSVLGEMQELLVNPKDIDAFAKKLLWANKESSDVAAYSKWLHEQALRYDVASVGNQLLALYNS